MKILKDQVIQKLPETIDDVNAIVIEINGHPRILQRVHTLPTHDIPGIPRAYLFDREFPDQVMVHPIPHRDFDARVVGVREVIL